MEWNWLKNGKLRTQHTLTHTFSQRAADVETVKDVLAADSSVVNTPDSLGKWTPLHYCVAPLVPPAGKGMLGFFSFASMKMIFVFVAVSQSHSS